MTYLKSCLSKSCSAQPPHNPPWSIRAHAGAEKQARTTPWRATGLMRARRRSLESSPKFKSILSVCICFYMPLVARSHLTSANLL